MLKHKNIVVASVLLFVLLFVFDAKWWAYVPVFIVFLGFTAWGSFDIRLGYFLKSHCKSTETQKREIAITFDDGPHEMTEKVLDLLDRYNSKATFFCVGTQTEKFPEILNRIIAQGHTVGNHSYSHPKSFGFLSAQKVKTEIAKNDELLSKFVGKKIKLFRSPFGVTNPNIAKALLQTQHYSIGWNIRSLDTVISDEKKILKKVKKAVQPGGIILLHDTSVKTVQVLEQLLSFLTTEKYEMITVDQLLNLNAYEN